MKTKIMMAFGFGVGTAIYGALTRGIQHVEWGRVAWVAFAVFLVILFVPSRVFEGKRKSGRPT